MPRSLPARAAASSASRLSMPSSAWICFARLGPRPGSRIIARTPAGIWLFSCSSSGSFPVSTISLIFPARSLPMPGSSSSFGVPVRTAASADAPSVSTVRAALR